jgi:uncharacterized membrane protein YkoI
MGVCTRPPSALIGLTGAILLGACGQSAQQTEPPPIPPPAPPPVPTPALPGTTPIYPSIGNRLGDPHRIGPDDLHWAVDSAQSAVAGSRLISVQPATDGGRPVWNVRLLTEGPSVKQVEVDAVVRGAKSADLPAPPADLAQTLVVENAIKTSWADAVDGLQRRNPGSTVSSVALDTSTLDPVWKVTLLTDSSQTQYTVNATTGVATGGAPGPRPKSDYR